MIENIIKMYRQGHYLEEIANEIGVDTCYINEVIEMYYTKKTLEEYMTNDSEG